MNCIFCNKDTMGGFMPIGDKYVCDECRKEIVKRHNDYTANDKPKTLNILGIPYSVTYCDNVLDVDFDKRETSLGCCEYKKQEIRIYDNNCNIQFIWQCILHEVLHLIHDTTNISILDIEGEKGKHVHNELDCLANVLTDFLFRNDLIKLEGKND